MVRVSDESGEAAGAGLEVGNISWRLVHRQRHGLHVTLAHTRIALRGHLLGGRKSELTFSQSQSSAPSDSAVRLTFSPAEKS